MNPLLQKISAWSYRRQCLGKSGTHMQTVLQAVLGVYSSHPTTSLSLWARLPSFDLAAFRALDQQRTGLRVPAMRLSAFMLPAETAARIFSATIAPADDPSWEKRYGPKGRGVPTESYPVWKAEIHQLCQQPLTVKELKSQISFPGEMLKFVLNRMAFEGVLLRVGAASLRSNIISYVSADAWAPDFKPVSGEEALEWLAGEYLRVFGPARIKDFQWWAGITQTKAKAAIAPHQTVDVGDGDLLLESDQAAFEAFDEKIEGTVDLLPQWDCYTMGYSPEGRDRFIKQEKQPQLYGKLGATGGNALGAVLINGIVQGVWTSRFKGTKMEVSLNLFVKLPKKVHEEVVDQFDQVSTLFGAKRIEIVLT